MRSREFMYPAITVLTPLHSRRFTLLHSRRFTSCASLAADQRASSFARTRARSPCTRARDAAAGWGRFSPCHAPKTMDFLAPQWGWARASFSACLPGASGCSLGRNPGVPPRAFLGDVSEHSVDSSNTNSNLGSSTISNASIGTGSLTEALELKLELERKFSNSDALSCKLERELSNSNSRAATQASRARTRTPTLDLGL